MAEQQAAPTAAQAFEAEKKAAMAAMGQAQDLRALTRAWFDLSCRHRYSYNFTWLGRPIIQFPQDIVALQEIVWKVKPDLIVETGIAHGGSLILSASLLHLLGGDGAVVGIDVDIRQHNRIEIEAHPLANRITMIQGSSVDEGVVRQVRDHARGKQCVLVILDSNHTHEHVSRELELYAPLVTKNSYLIVFDTIIEQMPDDAFTDRSWGKGNNPLTAVHGFLKTTDRFEIDQEMNDKLLITVAPDGYLRCIKD